MAKDTKDVLANRMLNANRKIKGGQGQMSPAIGANALNLKPGDNSKYIAVTLELFNAPDIDLTDPVAVQERLSWYFQLMFEADMKPTVAGMGLALNGMDRRRLAEIKSGALVGGISVQNAQKIAPESLDIIKKAYKFLENLHENWMNSGKINPVAGIFLAKNNFDYVDKTEHVITPNTDSDDQIDVNDIKKRYLTDEADIVDVEE